MKFQESFHKMEFLHENLLGLLPGAFPGVPSWRFSRKTSWNHQGFVREILQRFFMKLDQGSFDRGCPNGFFKSFAHGSPRRVFPVMPSEV